MIDRVFNRLAGEQQLPDEQEDSALFGGKSSVGPGSEGNSGESPQESEGETVLPDFNPTIKGTNSQNLIEKILRNRIYESLYWKEHCFGLTAADLVDKAVELTEVGGTYGPFHHPTRFMMLLLRMLEIMPEKSIVLEFIKIDEFRYVRLLGAFYMRLTGTPLDVYQYLEPLYNDYRKIKVWTPEGEKISHVDEFVWELVHGNFLCDISLPPIPKRFVLERSGALKPRVSVLDDFDDISDDDDNSENEKDDSSLGEANSKHDVPHDEIRKSERSPDPSTPSKHSHSKDTKETTKSGPDERKRLDSHDHSHHRRRRHHHHHSRSRSRSRSPSHRHHHRSRHRSRSSSSKGDKKDRSKSRSRSKSQHRHHHSKTQETEDPELVKMNELRASVGLPPLDHL